MGADCWAAHGSSYGTPAQEISDMMARKSAHVTATVSGA
jgi:hypothetical protein